MMINVAGMTVETFTCPRCGARIYPEAALRQHERWHERRDQYGERQKRVLRSFNRMFERVGKKGEVRKDASWLNDV